MCPTNNAEKVNVSILFLFLTLNFIFTVSLNHYRALSLLGRIRRANSLSDDEPGVGYVFQYKSWNDRNVVTWA